MTKRKRIEPALPVATDPFLRDLEEAKRREIAQLKETDLAEGRRASLSVSVGMSNIEARVMRGDKADAYQRKGTNAAHGTPAERAARKARVISVYTELQRMHPDWKKVQLEAGTVRRCGVSKSTVRRYIKPPQ